jgi:hypothetical protein
MLFIFPLVVLVLASVLSNLITAANMNGDVRIVPVFVGDKVHFTLCSSSVYFSLTRTLSSRGAEHRQATEPLERDVRRRSRPATLA